MGDTPVYSNWIAVVSNVFPNEGELGDTYPALKLCGMEDVTMCRFSSWRLGQFALLSVEQGRANPEAWNGRGHK